MCKFEHKPIAMNFLKTLLKFVGALVLIFLLYVVGNLIFATITDYQPEAITSVAIHNGQGDNIIDSTFSFLTWNIGYAGLGSKEDFFYDGGEMVLPSAERILSNLKGIHKFVKDVEKVDFLLLQEVDTNSKRSYYKNELRTIGKHLPEHEFAYATNYSVKFNPISGLVAGAPFPGIPMNAMGKLEAGIASYSRFHSEEATRYQFPGNYSWPNRIYFLDRCFLVQRYKLQNGKDLVVINTHNSAYDDGGLKQQQMEFMKEKLLEEYEKGNYVVVGGDWNQIPPGFDNNHFVKGRSVDGAYDQLPIADDYLPGWTWAYDDRVPTNRKLAKPYDAETTFTTLIDFFLVSPNLKVEEVNGVDLDFASSDHQPVKMNVSIR